MRKSDYQCIFILIFVTVLAYSNSFNCEFLNWDDNVYVVKNVYLRGITVENIKHLLLDYFIGEWYPLQMLSYFTDYQLWGLDVRGYHLTNLFFHTGSVILIYLIFQSLGFCRNTSLIAGILFAIFPPSVEAVTWIAQRKSVMCLFFMLLSFHLYIKDYFLFSLFVFLLSLLSKVTAISFPATIFFYEILIKNTFSLKTAISGLKKTLPFLLISLLTLLVFLHGQEEGKAIKDYELSRFGYSFVLFITSPIYGFISKMFLPVGLNPCYPPPVIGTISGKELITSGLIWIFGILPFIILFIKDMRSLFWLMFYLSFLIPIIIIVAIELPLDITETIPAGGDRHLYFLFPGFIGIILSALNRRLLKGNKVFFLIFSLWISASFLLTLQRNHVWKNDLSLWSDAVRKSPDYFFTRFAAGYSSLTEFYKTGKNIYLNSAISHLMKSVELVPTQMGHYFLAEAFEAQGDFEKALVHYEKSINVASWHQSPYPYRSIGRIYYNTGRYSESIRALEKAIEIDPAAYVLWNEKGMAELKAGLYDSAIASFERSLLLNYNQYDIHRKLGAIYFKEKKDEATALNHFEASLRLNPYQEDAETLVRVVEELRKKIK